MLRFLAQRISSFPALLYSHTTHTACPASTSAFLPSYSLTAGIKINCSKQDQHTTCSANERRRPTASRCRSVCSSLTHTQTSTPTLCILSLPSIPLSRARRSPSRVARHFTSAHDGHRTPWLALRALTITTAATPHQTRRPTKPHHGETPRNDEHLLIDFDLSFKMQH